MAGFLTYGGNPLGEMWKSLLVPMANILKEATGSWHAVFLTAAVLNVIAALLGLFVLKPMRRAQIERTNQQAAQAQASVPGAVVA